MPVGVTEHENRQVLDMIAELYKFENEVIIAGIDGTRDHLEIWKKSRNRQQDMAMDRRPKRKTIAGKQDGQSE
jgi:hypothetical protein